MIITIGAHLTRIRGTLQLFRSNSRWQNTETLSLLILNIEYRENTRLGTGSWLHSSRVNCSTQVFLFVLNFHLPVISFLRETLFECQSHLHQLRQLLPKNLIELAKQCQNYALFHAILVASESHLDDVCSLQRTADSILFSSLFLISAPARFCGRCGVAF